MEEQNNQENNQTASCGQCEEYLNGWKRALADYDNLKKDLTKEREAMSDRIKEDNVLRLINLSDNFDRAFASAPQEPKEWISGIGYIKTQLEEIIRGYGAQRFAEVGG